MAKRAASLTVQLRGHDVELTCVCTLTLVQPLRAVIADSARVVGGAGGDERPDTVRCRGAGSEGQ
jgi:hypothetical protein